MTQATSSYPHLSLQLNQLDFSFTIINKPEWATFDPKTGNLAGIPTAGSATQGIVISVTDGGKSPASLAPFNLTVLEPTATVTDTPTETSTPSPTATVTYTPTVAQTHSHPDPYSYPNPHGYT